MTVSKKYLLGRGALLILILTCLAAQLRPEQLERGGEWLSWSQGERNTYVYGLISGYRRGSLKACNVADDLIEVGQPHRLGDAQHPSEMPSARCLARRDNYSKCKYINSVVECSAYTTVITEFYTKHPEYQGIPFPFLMDFMSDSNYKIADQLYQMALRGELRPVR